MNTKKAFTVVELLVLLAILVLLIGMIIPAVASAGITLFSLVKFVGYFVPPAIIFGLFVKLNHKYKWVVKKQYAYSTDGYKVMYNKIYIDSNIAYAIIVGYFLLWPCVTPLIPIGLLAAWLYNKFLKGKSLFPN